MKRLMLIFLVIAFLFTLYGCGTTASKSNTSQKSTTYTQVTAQSGSMTEDTSSGVFSEHRAVWISFFELNFTDKTEAYFKTEIGKMFDSIKNAGFNAVYVHIRANSDSFYPSAYFPWSALLTGTQGKNPGYDPMKFMIDAAHSRLLKFYAWINPFRVSTASDDITKLSEDNPARIYLSDKDKSNDNWAVKYNKGIYYNPAVPEVQKLILNGVREIVKNYSVDGICYDDYFYPTTSTEFDKTTYDTYLNTKPSNPLSLDNYRRTQINAFVSGTYSAIKSIKRNVVFCISPQANMDTNYSKLYADVSYWVKNNGFVDSIMPQLYFGFEYEKTISSTQSFKYNELLQYWSDLCTNKNVKLYIALGMYKSGTVDNGSNEWIDHSDILKRQVDLNRTVINCAGFSVYSYSSLFSNSKTNTAERQNLFSIMHE